MIAASQISRQAHVRTQSPRTYHVKSVEDYNTRVQNSNAKAVTKEEPIPTGAMIEHEEEPTEMELRLQRAREEDLKNLKATQRAMKQLVFSPANCQQALSSSSGKKRDSQVAADRRFCITRPKVVLAAHPVMRRTIQSFAEEQKMKKQQRLERALEKEKLLREVEYTVAWSPDKGKDWVMRSTPAVDPSNRIDVEKEIATQAKIEQERSKMEAVVVSASQPWSVISEPSSVEWAHWRPLQRPAVTLPKSAPLPREAASLLFKSPSRSPSPPQNLEAKTTESKIPTVKKPTQPSSQRKTTAPLVGLRMVAGFTGDAYLHTGARRKGLQSGELPPDPKVQPWNAKGTFVRQFDRPTSAGAYSLALCGDQRQVKQCLTLRDGALASRQKVWSALWKSKPSPFPMLL